MGQGFPFMNELIVYKLGCMEKFIERPGIVIVGQLKIIYKVLGIDERWTWWR